MTAYCKWGPGARAVLVRLMLAMFLLAPASLVMSAERAQLFVTKESGFGRLALSFPDRLDLPGYKIRYENGVLAVEFDEELDLVLPDIAVTLPDYVTVARIDPDRKGLRLGLRTTLSLNHMEAGEKLFIDMMPTSWKGLPPGMPPEVIAELAERAKEAALRAARERKAEEAKRLKPVATVRVGRNPTFVRLEFDWSVPTKGQFTLDGEGRIDFDWPVPIDLYALKADLPPEILGAESAVTAKGSRVTLALAEGVEPRFYQATDRTFIVDIDIAHESADEATTLEELAKLMPAATGLKPDVRAADATSGEGAIAPLDQTEITPTVSSTGSTVRINFPFERDTAAAVFRRGNIVWLMFDTGVSIRQPVQSPELASVASTFSVSPAGDTQVVRLDLDVDRLATLGSEGRSWVLSLGDILLSPAESLPLSRRRNTDGAFEMIADVQRPSRVHQFRDPIVGDVLSIVTAFPPARGISRPLKYVDFAALPSIQGLVVRPEHDGVEVAIAERNAVITSEDGLALSPMEQARVIDTGVAATQRETFVDLAGPREEDPAAFVADREEMIGQAAAAEGRGRDQARLDLARFYLANQFSLEAIGVLEVMLDELKTDELRRPARLTLAIAETMAHRPQEALDILTGPGLAEEVDVMMWRAIARTDLEDFNAARLDAMAAELAVESYPRWVREAFLFAGMRAAVETKDYTLAQHFLSMLEYAKLEPEQASWFQFFTARIAEGNNRVEEALDGYGQVISADFRPSRAEAVYRTLLLLDQSGRIDIDKATQTLSAEVLLWRGDRLESLMEQFLSELYFRSGKYRDGFETVRQAVAYFPETPSSDALLAKAQSVFSELYLDGRADQLEPVDALSLYYDFRELTPPGARGDEMIRNLARRLVKVDLLAQAGDLLEYQIDSRLSGAAQAQVAADLAVIRLADRNPEAALRALNRSRLADLPPSLERQRRVLEARALIDADRQDLALDLLRSLSGRDADLLRIDGMWKSKQYQAAAELLEVIYSPQDATDTMNQPARMNIIKAAVGFVMAGDGLGLSRLRSKFGARMANSAEWPLFDFVTGDVTMQSTEFRKLAHEVSGLDSLDAFLSAYRNLYSASTDPMPDKAAPADRQG